jgi:hypothetical protein
MAIEEARMAAHESTNTQGDAVNRSVSSGNTWRAANNPRGEDAHRAEVVARATANRKQS